MKKILIISFVFVIFFPIVVDAALEVGGALDTILTNVRDIINIIVIILMAVATVVFLWGMVKYVMAGGDEKAKESSKGIIKAGIIGLFMMVAIWGIVNVIAITFGVRDERIPLGPGYEDPRTP